MINLGKLVNLVGLVDLVTAVYSALPITRLTVVGDGHSYFDGWSFT